MIAEIFSRLAGSFMTGSVRVLLVICLIFLASTAGAQTPSVDERVNNLMSQGKFADAYELAEREWPQQTPNRALRLDFIRAMSLKGQGKHREAIAILRRINSENPSFTRVRAELAQSLFLVGDHDAAQFYFTDLSRSINDASLREAFDSYLSAIRRNRPYRLNAYISFAPSTNINNRTTTDIITVNGLPFRLTEESRAKSGVGLSGGLSGDYSFYFNDSLSLTLGGRINGTKYKQEDFDRLLLSGNAFLRKREGNQTYGIGLMANHYNQGYKTYRNNIGGAVEYGRSFRNGHQFSVSARLMRQKYPYAAFLDGWEADASVTGRKTLAPGHHMTGGLRFTAERTKRDYYDNDGMGFFISHSREWNGGLITEVEPSMKIRWYRAIDPFLGVKRRDTEIGGAIRLMHRKVNFQGYTPRIEYSYMRQFSNNPLQERDNHSLNVFLTREF